MFPRNMVNISSLVSSRIETKVH